MTAYPTASPRLARLLIGCFVRGEANEIVLGDLEEEYHTHILPALGVNEARAWYWRHTLGSIGAVFKRRRPGRLVRTRTDMTHAMRSARRVGWRKGGLMSGLIHDIRYAVRGIRTSKAVTALAVLMLAVGIGATTAIFSVANWLVLRQVAGVSDPDRLADVRFGTESERGFSPRSVSYPNYRDLVAGTPALAGLAGYSTSAVHASTDGRRARRVMGESVTANYFDVLGVRSSVGRFFRQEDDVIGAPPTVVIGDRLWATFFDRSTDVLGKTLRLNGIDFTVIGVAPEEFRGTLQAIETDVWFPGTIYPRVRHLPPDNAYGSRDRGAFYEFVARLGEGATFEQVQDQLHAAALGLAEAYPEVNEKFSEPTAHVYPGLGARVLGNERVRDTLLLLSGVVAMVLLIACANVANLLLFRGVRRRGENAVRRALGATGGRVVRGHLIESIILALLGGVAGVAFAVALMQMFEGTTLIGVFRALEDVKLDARVLAFTVAVAVASGVIFGTLPAISAARADFATALKDSTGIETGKSPLFRRALMVLQLGGSVTLLVGALLFVTTLRNVNDVDLGFDPTGVTAFAVNPMGQGYSPAEMQSYYSELLRRVSDVPEVQSQSMSYLTPFMWSYQLRLFPTGADPEETSVITKMNSVTPGYFETLGIEVVRGRTFRESETFSDRVDHPVVLSEMLTRRLFGEVDALGRYVSITRGQRVPSDHLVVGVARDTRWNDLRGELGPMLYRPLGGSIIRAGDAVLLVRSAEPRAAVSTVVADIASGLDSSLPLYNEEGMAERVAQHVSEEALFAKTIGLLAILAVCLAAVGLYGLVAFGVAERTREFGIRLALGAEGGRIVRLVLRQSGVLAALGVALGLGGAVALTRFVESRLFGISALNPTVYVSAAAALGAVALFATYWPARTATRVDPVVALRHE